MAALHPIVRLELWMFFKVPSNPSCSVILWIGINVTKKLWEEERCFVCWSVLVLENQKIILKVPFPSASLFLYFCFKGDRNLSAQSLHVTALFWLTVRVYWSFVTALRYTGSNSNWAPAPVPSSAIFCCSPTPFYVNNCPPLRWRAVFMIWEVSPDMPMNCLFSCVQGVQGSLQLVSSVWAAPSLCVSPHGALCCWHPWALPLEAELQFAQVVHSSCWSF